MKKLFWLCGLLMLAAPDKTTAQNDGLCVEDNTNYQSGESISFQVFFKLGLMNAHAGNVNFTVTEREYNDDMSYHIVGVGKTVSSYEWFYKVNDTYESWVDQATGLPLRFKRNINEGGYKIMQEYTFDNPNNHAMIVKSVTNGETKITNKKYNVNQCVQDVLSAIYRCRNIDFTTKKAGDRIPLTIFIDGDQYEINLNYLGKETIKTKLGTLRCNKFRANLVKGTIFEGDEEVLVWATDDKNQVPVLIEAPIVVGRIRATISNWSGLRNSITSKK